MGAILKHFYGRWTSTYGNVFKAVIEANANPCLSDFVRAVPFWQEWYHGRVSGYQMVPTRLF